MSAQPKVTPNFGRRFGWLPCRELQVHPDAQRPLVAAKVKRLADELDPDAIGVLCVVEIPVRNGTAYYLVDGQHRNAAVMRALGEDQMVYCEILTGVSIAEAARMFRKRNTSTKPSAFEMFRIGVTAGDPECVAINDVVNSCGLVVSDNKAPGSVRAVAALRWVYRGEKSRGNGKNALALKRTLITIIQAWGKGSDVPTGEIIKGIGAVVLRHGDAIDFTALESRLRKYDGGAGGLHGAAKGIAKMYAGSVSNAVASLVALEYNKGRKPGNKLPPWMRGQDDA